MAGDKASAAWRQALLRELLASSPRPMTLKEIFRQATGYREDIGPSGRSSALEKRFQRDREALGKAGVVIESIPDPVNPGDLSAVTYRIQVVDPAQAATPANVVLNPVDLMLIKVASKLWDEVEIRENARRAAQKLVTADVELADVPTSFPKLTIVTHPAFKALQDAQYSHLRVRFSYHKPGVDEPRQRLVTPLRVVNRHGRWLLDAWDHDQHDYRTFLLNRIIGEITQEGPDDSQHKPNPQFDQELALIAKRNTVLVRAVADSASYGTLSSLGILAESQDGEAQDGAQAGRDILLGDADIDLLVSLLARHARDAVVVEPEPIRTKVVRRLRDALAAHEGAVA